MRYSESMFGTDDMEEFNSAVDDVNIDSFDDLEDVDFQDLDEVAHNLDAQDPEDHGPINDAHALPEGGRVRGLDDDDDLNDLEAADALTTADMAVDAQLIWESAAQLDNEGIHVTYDVDVLKLYADASSLGHAIVHSTEDLFRVQSIGHRAERALLVCQPLGSKLLSWIERATRSLHFLRETTNVGFELEADPWARLLLHFDMTGYPMSNRQGWHGQVQGWVTNLNGAVDDLRYVGRSAHFRKEIAQRKRHSRDSAIALKQYLQALSRQHAKLLVLRIDFGYRYDPKVHIMGPRVPPATVGEHRAKLIEYYQTRFAGVELGYISKTEFGLCKGPHLHMVFILDGSNLRSDVIIAAMLGEHWRREVTAGDGTYFNCNRIKARYLSCGIGLVDYRNPEDWAGAEAMVEYITKPDYIAPVWAVGYRTLVKGQMPAAQEKKLGRPRSKTYDDPLSEAA